MLAFLNIFLKFNSFFKILFGGIANIFVNLRERDLLCRKESSCYPHKLKLRCGKIRYWCMVDFNCYNIHLLLLPACLLPLAISWSNINATELTLHLYPIQENEESADREYNQKKVGILSEFMLLGTDNTI